MPRSTANDIQANMESPNATQPTENVINPATWSGTASLLRMTATASTTIEQGPYRGHAPGLVQPQP